MRLTSKTGTWPLSVHGGAGAETEKGRFMQGMRTQEDVAGLIRAGRRLLVAADEALLAGLPAGEWIGGSIPYFMTEAGGMFSRDLIHVTLLPDYVDSASIAVYGAESVASIYRDAPDHGFSLAIVPASSPTHLAFALGALDFVGYATRPLVGWVAGVATQMLETARPLVFDGRTGTGRADGMVVLHATLPASYYAEVQSINIFRPGDGPIIEFPNDSFLAREAWVDGRRVRFADWCRGRDLRLPLITEYLGMTINTSFQGIRGSGENASVHFYAPVFRGQRYRHAAPVGDYAAAFASRLEGERPIAGQETLFACNCVLNYLFGELEGKRMGTLTGPITFGEIAYQLLNQTMVRLMLLRRF
jgi:hypothetical protein